MKGVVIETGPVAVVIDRSRDSGAGSSLLRLPCNHALCVADNRAPLSVRLLSCFDALVVAGSGGRAYSLAERRAVRAFVRRGGGLIIAASAGLFEHRSGRPAARLAANSLACEFGFQLLAPAGLPIALEVDPWTTSFAAPVPAYPRDRLRLTAAGERLGLPVGQIPLRRPGPLKVPPGARILLFDADSRTPVAAVARFGRGRVLVLHDFALFGSEDVRSESKPAVDWLQAVLPRTRRQSRQPLDLPVPPMRIFKRGHFTVHYWPQTRRRLSSVLRLTEAVLPFFRELGKNKTPQDVHIYLEHGCGHWRQWHGPGTPVRLHLGAELTDVAVVGALAESIAWWKLVDWFPWQDARVFAEPLFHELRLQVLRRLGFADPAKLQEQALADGPPVNLGRRYSEAPPVPGHVRFFTDVRGRFGDDAVFKFLQAMPRENPCDGISREVYNGFDIGAFFLARALGRKVYDWLQEQGHSLRRIPLQPPKSARLKHAITAELRRLVRDSQADACDRLDAVTCLASRLRRDKLPLERCAALAAGRATAFAFPAAVRLLQAADQRGPSAVRRWLAVADHGLAASAALFLVREARDTNAAGVLVRLAPRFSTRFQLTAGHALRCAGDRRAVRWSLRRLPGCGVKIIEAGMAYGFAVVDGYEVANVFAMPVLQPLGPSTFSSYYIQWVHTDPYWRRRGLAAETIRQVARHPWHRDCATTSLHTGTRNVAHRMYRGVGLLDYVIFRDFTKELAAEPSAKLPKGVRLRPASAAEAPQAFALVRNCQNDGPRHLPRLESWPDSKLAFSAWRGRQLVGLVRGQIEGPNAYVTQLALAPAPSTNGAEDHTREDIGVALVTAVARSARRLGAKKLSSGRGMGAAEDAARVAVLRRCGFSNTLSPLGGGVELHRIVSLPRFFTEIKDTLEHRLAQSPLAGWSGVIALSGHRLAAALRVKNGRILDVTPHRPHSALLLLGNDHTIQRVAIGTASAFEEYLQLRLHVDPGVTPATQELLEVLFPRTVFPS